MNEKLAFGKEYKNWIGRLSNRYRIAQIKAAVAVNTAMLKFYWELGRDIVSMESGKKYGNKFIEKLSKDLQEAIPDAKGLSPRNIYAIKQFYTMYEKISPQLVAKSDSGESSFLYDEIFQIPWGHHRLLINKYYSDPNIALFYVRETLKNGWSRAVLEHEIDMKLHVRQGKGITNFKSQLPMPESDLAQELTKDPYIFDFTNLTEPYRERELKEQLLKNITKFLLELGEGFAFVGQEYKLNVGQTEQFADLLFYHLKLRCYFVIELKVTKFEPGFVGQLGMYVSAVNHLLKGENDNPTIGLLICKTKDDVLAQYSLEGYNLPLSVSQYQIERFLPDNFKSALPSVEDIEAELKSDN